MKTKLLTAEIFKCRLYGTNCTTGISAEFDQVGILGLDGPFDPRDDIPVVQVITRNLRATGEYHHIEPLVVGDRPHFMAGGCIVSTSDSRLFDVSPYPLKLHDRVEDKSERWCIRNEQDEYYSDSIYCQWSATRWFAHHFASQVEANVLCKKMTGCRVVPINLTWRRRWRISDGNGKFFYCHFDGSTTRQAWTENKAQAYVYDSWQMGQTVVGDIRSTLGIDATLEEYWA